MPSMIETMLIRRHGKAWLEDVRKTPLCELRTRLSPEDRAYGGLQSSDRGSLPTSDYVNALVDNALGYQKKIK